MKCLKCGMELPEGSKFCIQCGTKVGNESGEVETENVKEERTPDSHSTKQTKENSKGRNLWTSIKDKICQEWRKLSLFGKIMTIAIIICTLLCFIAFVSDNLE